VLGFVSFVRQRTAQDQAQSRKQGLAMNEGRECVRSGPLIKAVFWSGLFTLTFLGIWFRLCHAVFLK
jgi:hypothetical protein